MRSPAFPPRRPSALLRYLVPAFLLCLAFYYLSGTGQDISTLETQLPVKPPQVDDPKPAWAEKGTATHNDIPKPPPSKPDVLTTTTSSTKLSTTSKSSAAAKTSETLKTSTTSAASHTETKVPAKDPASSAHPIDTLIANAEKEFTAVLKKESHTLAEAAAAYRERRGRHPPPGFDEWYSFAKDKKAIIVEDFWDQVYHDLEPFWAIAPGLIRKQAWEYEMTINLRDHKATAGSDWFWTQIWLNLIKTVEHLLPDLDIALNAMDEPRLVVPWEDIDGYMTEAHKTRHMPDPSNVINEYQRLDKPGEGPDNDIEVPKTEWEGTKPYWKVARRGCAPTSLARKAEIMTNFDHTPVISRHLAAAHSHKGYVANYSLSTDFCHQPDLQNLNGIFVEPLTVSATKSLFPMFGGSKLAVNNEILLPAPMYWNEEERFTGGDDHGGPWAEKTDGAIWRGVATGGKNRENTWRAFQRHRFVAMNNATKLEAAQDWTALPANFELPGQEYGIKVQQEGKLGKWVGSWADVGFVDLFCTPEEEGGTCNYTSPHFSVVKGMRMNEQFSHKYLPDIDGNSFSGRYLGFLRSTSLPVKATLWREWHDSRLTAWKHFVPMDNRYGDWFGIMEYFLGYNSASAVAGHDKEAEKIANAGKEWAEKVLRKEDMQVYVLRLLLEYARICDEKRESMGWVGDLVKDAVEDLVMDSK
ncbi:hypothetical protein GE09DRAFT_1061844 [Coniochaeta sp. 2T2.1]|nr:hypothetical protein GE09DRAFT_1061844 [Coniochaeta sp. 2T2.1]